VATYPPVAADGVVYVAGEGHLVAVHAASGARLWDLPLHVFSAPVVVGGLVFIVVTDYSTGSSDVHTLRVADGRLVRSFAGANTVQAAPGGVVYVSGAGVYALRPGGGAATDIWSRPGGTVLTTGPGIVVAGEGDRGFVLHAQDGTLLWAFPAVGLPPLVAEGRVYLSPNDNGPAEGGAATALRLRDGAELWRFPASSTVQLATGGVAYLSNPYDNNGEFYAVRASDGAMLWRLPANGASAALDNEFSVAVAVDRGVVYLGGNRAVGAPRGWVSALRARDGRRLWAWPTLGDGVHAIQFVSGVLYVSDGGETMGLGGGGRVSALRARDGTKIWSATIGGASPDVVVANEVVYVSHTVSSITTTSNSSTVVALRRDTGVRKWSVAALPEGFYGAAVTVDGHTAYVYGGDGKLYALRS
jgi:outer membrane protein assembly factor BamB